MIIINDVVHNISLPDYVNQFISTPHFQRLKKLKQLGVSSFFKRFEVSKISQRKNNFFNNFILIKESNSYEI